MLPHIGDLFVSLHLELGGILGKVGMVVFIHIMLSISRRGHNICLSVYDFLCQCGTRSDLEIVPENVDTLAMSFKW